MAGSSVPSPPIYCPYTDREIPVEQSSAEHIISLALGGHDDLTIPVDSDANSHLGSKIDGALANEVFVARQRVKHDARGHSGREPKVTLRGVRDQATGKPLAVKWGKTFEIYDPIERKPRTDALTFEATLTINVDIRQRFLAKCFLSAGYLAYGELFRRAVEHREPRLLMTRAVGELSDAERASIKTRFFTWYKTDMPDQFQAEEYGVQNLICAMVKGSLLVFMPGPKNLGFFGGVLGAYLGMMNVPADTSEFPRFDDHDLGHAIIVSNGHVLRWSYRRLLARLLPEMEKVEKKKTRTVPDPSA